LANRSLSVSGTRPIHMQRTAIDLPAATVRTESGRTTICLTVGNPDIIRLQERSCAPARRWAVHTSNIRWRLHGPD
jgi:hypothetical protein